MAAIEKETQHRPFCLAVGKHLSTFQAKAVLKYLDKTSVFRQNIITSTIVIWVSLLTGPLCVSPLLPSTLQVRFPNRDARDMQHDNPRSAQFPRSVRCPICAVTPRGAPMHLAQRCRRRLRYGRHGRTAAGRTRR